MTKISRITISNNNIFLNDIGFARVKSIEVEDNNQIIRLEAYRHKFIQLMFLDDNEIKEHTVYAGKALDERGQRLYKWAIGEIKKISQNPGFWVKQAQILHTPHPAQPADLVEPEITISDPIVVYPTPIGAHGAYVWNYRDWSAAKNSSDPIVKSLYVSKARVFPRYARKAFAGYKPGDFIGLGGPDAKFYKNDANAVRFIQEHTAIRV